MSSCSVSDSLDDLFNRIDDQLYPTESTPTTDTNNSTSPDFSDEEEVLTLSELKYNLGVADYNSSDSFYLNNGYLNEAYVDMPEDVTVVNSKCKTLFISLFNDSKFMSCNDLEWSIVNINGIAMSTINKTNYSYVSKLSLSAFGEDDFIVKVISKSNPSINKTCKISFLKNIDGIMFPASAFAVKNPEYWVTDDPYTDIIDMNGYSLISTNANDYSLNEFNVDYNCYSTGGSYCNGLLKFNTKIEITLTDAAKEIVKNYSTMIDKVIDGMITTSFRDLTYNFFSSLSTSQFRDKGVELLREYSSKSGAIFNIKVSIDKVFNGDVVNTVYKNFQLFNFS